MSLLMDALKKAEKEKKEAAKQRTGESPVTDTGEIPVMDESGAYSNTDSHEIPVNLDTSEIPLSLEPLNQTLNETSQIPNDNTLSTEMPIENTSEHPVVRQQEESDAFELTDTGELGFENTEEYQTRLDSTSAEFEIEADQTREDVLATDDTVEDSAYFSDSIEEGLPFEETLDSVTASQLLKDIGQFEGQPTPGCCKYCLSGTKGRAMGE